MSITLYHVNDYFEWPGEEGGPFHIATCFTADRAVRRAKDVAEKWPGEEDVRVDQEEVDALDRQKVTIDGWNVGYQFSRTRMGVRTVRRKVSNVRWEGDVIYGEVEFLGRRILVKWDPANFRCWFDKRWLTVSVLGHVGDGRSRRDRSSTRKE